MNIPVIAGLSMTTWGGMLLVILIVFQILNGKRIIKVPPACHKVTAIAILVLALIHALVGIGTALGWF
jgi:hypothetical protein